MSMVILTVEPVRDETRCLHMVQRGLWGMAEGMLSHGGCPAEKGCATGMLSPWYMVPRLTATSIMLKC